MAEQKKESSSARRARLSKERSARRAALKAQGSKNTSTVVRGVADMLFGKKEKPKAKPAAKPAATKGGAIKKVQSTKDALNRNRRGRITRTKAAVGSKGSTTKSATPKRLPPGKKGGPLAKPTKALPGATGPKGLLKSGTTNLGRALRFGGRLLAGRDDGSGSALLAAKMTSDAIDAARGSTAEERNSKKVQPKKTVKKNKPVNTRGGQGGSKAKSNRKPKEEKKPKRQVTSRNRRGRPTSYAAPVKPAKRGLSNIPPKEGTGKGSPTDKKKVSKVTAPKPQSKPPVKASKPRSATPKTSSASTYNKHGSALHVGRYKTLAEHRAAVAAQKKKKKSNANKKGWQGNRNY